MKYAPQRVLERQAPNNAICTVELSVIIPVRITDSRQDILNRINFYKIDNSMPTGIEFLVVDDGSSDRDFENLRTLEANHVRVLRTSGKVFEPFSLVRARNLGAQQARGRFILFMDADLFPYPGFYRDLLREARHLEIRKYVNRFLMVPVIYATAKGYEQMLQMEPDDWRSFMINAMNRKDDELIEKFSSGTSVILVERSYYLARGGQDEEFSGWGFEDYEFNNRLIRRARMFPLPSNWLSMSGNFMTLKTYEGWKACYRLHGDWLATKAIYLFHAPHPIEESYLSRKDYNLKLLLAKMKEDASKSNEPDPLPDPFLGSSLVLRRNPFVYQREFAPFLGHVTFAHEDDFSSAEELIDFVREGQFTRIVFPNPYANERILDLYRWCRANNQGMIVAERGALPDSVYHDKSGFLSDGDSYAPEKWCNPLSKEELDATVKYIADIRNGDSMLEAQSPRGDILQLKEKLKLKRGQRVLLVPFQQPNDTVIRYFSGQTSFQQFHSLIRSLVTELDDKWVVIYRRHPSEKVLEPIPGALDGSDYNLYDLLELTDSIALINSGVGIYGLMYGKPVYVFGDAWYAFDGITKTIKDTRPEKVASQINAGYEVDYDRILQFIHYLRYRFYSFGKMNTRRVTTPEGSQITATVSIDYYELRGWSGETRYLSAFEKRIGVNSPMFDRYRGSEMATKSIQPAQPIAQSRTAAISQPTQLGNVGKNYETEGKLAYHQERFDDAVRHFKEWVAEKPEYAAAHRSLAESYIKVGMIELARKHLLIASELIPDNKNVKKRLNDLKQGFWSRISKRKQTPFLIDKP